MTNKDSLEFYDGNKLICSIRSSIIPPIGSKVSIQKKAWTVVMITYAVDYSAHTSIEYRQMRANIDLEEIK